MDRILGWLPKRPQPWAVRYGVTTLVMVACCAAQLGLAEATGLIGLFFVVVAIFLCAVAFDRRCGIYAAVLASVSSYFIIRQWVPSVPAWSAGIFFILASGISLFGETLRGSIERAVSAERDSALLLRELSHRTQNNLAITAAILDLESRADASADVKAALEKASARIRVLSDAHRHLEQSGTGVVDLCEYIRRICEQIEQMIGGLRAIHCYAEPIKVSVDKAVALGLIVNELITNALKHAFGDAARGTVTVTVARHGAEHIALVVSDDGRGSSETAVRGLGTKLIDLMVQQHEGEIVRKNADPGYCVSITMPR